MFNELAPSDRVLSIDRLEIRIPAQSFRHPAEAATHLERELRQQLRQMGIFDPSSDPTDAPALTRELRRDEWMRLFFETGALPWWQSAMPRERFQTEFIEWIHSEAAASTWLFERSAHRANVAQRVANHLNLDAFDALLAVLAGGLEFEPILELGLDLAILEQPPPAVSLPKFYLKLWIRLTESNASLPLRSHAIEEAILPMLRLNLRRAFDQGRADYLRRFSSGFIRFSGPTKAMLARLVLSEVGRIEPRLATVSPRKFELYSDEIAALASENIPFVPKKLLQTASLWARAEGVKSEQVATDETAALADRREETPDPSPTHRATPATNATKRPTPTASQPADFDDLEPTEQDALYIQNAGLAILAPFLPTLFERCGIVLSLDSSERQYAEFAPALLQALVAPGEAIMEYALPLNKILCGFPLQQSVPTDSDFSAEWVSHGDDLMRSVIKMWGRLGATSPDAFRSTFLARSGSLFKSDFGWTLRVERSPFDVLIDTIPWTFQTIRYSWMTQPLLVEW